MRFQGRRPKAPGPKLEVYQLELADFDPERVRALGKVDERGQIAEDLRTQILGQLSMQVNYASLYSEALNDPLLKRTRVELETAMSNAVEARKLVFELVPRP